MVKQNKLYNVAAVLQDGEIKAFIPKTFLPNYGEFYEVRHFEKGNEITQWIDLEGQMIPFGTNILFEIDAIEGLVVGCEICEDVWSVNPPSTRHVQAGANIIVNLSASNETVSKSEYRKELIKSTSARLMSGYVCLFYVN